MKLRALMDAISDAKICSSDVRPHVAAYVAGLGVSRIDRPTRVMVYSGDPGVAPYRVYAPYLELAKDPRFEVQISQTLKFPDDLRWADVMVFARTTFASLVDDSPTIKSPVHLAAEACVGTMYEIDDWVHGVPDYNPCSVGVAKANQPSVVERIMRDVDCVTVSTRRLAELYRPMARRIAVLPNCVVPELCGRTVENLFGKKDESVVNIAWAGSDTHYDDLRLVVPVLADIMRERRSVRFWRFGAGGLDVARDSDGGFVGSNLFRELPQDRIVPIGWTQYPHYMPNLLSQIDIGLAPLVRNVFNEAKSAVKLLEYSVAGVPTVATRIDPYSEHMGHAALVGDNSPDAWRRQIELLIDDAESRRSIGAAARRYALDRLAIGRHVDGWAKIVLELGAKKRAIEIAGSSSVASRRAPMTAKG